MSVSVVSIGKDEWKSFWIGNRINLTEFIWANKELPMNFVTPRVRRESYEQLGFFMLSMENNIEIRGLTIVRHLPCLIILRLKHESLWLVEIQLVVTKSICTQLGWTGSLEPAPSLWSPINLTVGRRAEHTVLKAHAAAVGFGVRRLGENFTVKDIGLLFSSLGEQSYCRESLSLALNICPPYENLMKYRNDKKK